MKIYRCTKPWFSGLVLTLALKRGDYLKPEEAEQNGTGDDALYHAFRDHRLNVGDVVELDDHTRWRCEMAGWTEVSDQQWTARIRQGQARERG